MTILVTGGAGFIGSHLVDALLDKGLKVVVIDNLNDYYDPQIKRSNIEHNLNNENFSFYQLDITKNIEEVFLNHKIHKIVHLAARAGVRPSLKDPFIYEKVNIKGTMNLLELAVKYKVENFVFGSSSSVYGNNAKIPFDEQDNTDCAISPYAATKKAGEVLCYTYSHLYHLNITCLRFFTVYGPRGRPDMAPYLFTKLIDEGKPITMFGDGSSKRDYTYISDIIDGILNAVEANFRYEIINLGNSKTVQLTKLISVIESKLGKTAKINKKEMPKGDVKITYANILKAKTLLNFDPKVSIEDGISDFVDWYRNSKTFKNPSPSKGIQKTRI